MKTSIFKSLLILTTLVIPLVVNPLYAHGNKGNKGKNKGQQCSYTIQQGNKGENCVVVTPGATTFETTSKGVVVFTDFTISEPVKKTLNTMYSFDIDFAQDNKVCNKLEAQIEKRPVGRFKAKKKSKGLEFTSKKIFKNKRFSKCDITAISVKVFKINKGNLGTANTTPTTPPPAPEMCEWNEAIEATDPACQEPPRCEWNSDIYADDSSCVEPPRCEWNQDIYADDQNCVEPVTYVSKAEQIANLRQIVYTKASELGLNTSGTRFVGLDIGNDGDQDILAIYAFHWDGQEGPAVLYINDTTSENGWIEQDINLNTNSGYRSAVVGDFTGDGQDDVFIYNGAGYNVMLTQMNGSLYNNGYIPEEDGTSTYTKGYQKHMVKHSAADFDGDGDLDVFVVAQNDFDQYRADSHIWYINDGNGNFTPEYRTDRTQRGIWYNYVLSSAIADFDRDGTLDVYLGTANNDNGSTNYGLGNQMFGNVDALICSKGGKYKKLISRTTNHGVSSSSAEHIDVVADDVNGDGNPDIIALNFDTTTKGNSRVEIKLGNGDGTFETAQVLWNSTRGDARIGYEDVNGDGLKDIVTIPQSQAYTYRNLTNAGTSYVLNNTKSTVYINQGNGQFVEDMGVTIDKVSILTAMFFVTDNNAYNPIELH
jgi:hypothetical protein